VTPCPSGEQLERFLGEELAATERDTIEGHVEECAPCQQWLEHFVNKDATLWVRGPHETLAFGSSTEGSLEAGVGGATSSGGRFRILRFHAKGGLGQVSVALDEELHREVALKEIQGRYAHDPEYRSRFLSEAEITGGLEHPGVVPVYGLGRHADGRPFYAMRFIKGDNFRTAIERFHETSFPTPGERALALRKLLGRFLDVCNVIAYAHSRRVLHRDLKPGNIMLGDYGETLVVDWGLAKPFDRPTEPIGPVESPLRPTLNSGSTRTEIGQVVGSAPYMSPEQAAGRLDLIGPATDIFGLGATLYHLLTNRPPFVREDSDMLSKVERCEFPLPRKINPAASAGLEAICLKAMALRPEDRYATPRHLANDVEQWLADEPVSAWHEPWSIRARRWMRRHRLLVSSGVAALAVSVVALAVGLVVVDGARQRENSARKEADRRFQSERDAVNQFYTEVSQNPRLLRKEPGTQQLRRTLLDMARNYYERFLEDNREDPALMADVAAAYFRLGTITSELDPGPKALEYLGRALEIREQLERRNPDSPEARIELADVHHEIGTVLTRDLAQHQEALVAFDKARIIKEELTRQEHPNLRYSQSLANTLSDSGSAALKASNKRREAAALLDASRQIFQKLAADHPDQVDLDEDMVNLYKNLATQAVIMQQFDIGESFYNRAREIAEKLQRKDPDSSTAIWRVAMIRTASGELQRQKHNYDAARTELHESRTLLERVSRENPSAGFYAQQLATVLERLGETELNAGRAVEALPLYEQGRNVMERLATHDPLQSGFADTMILIHKGIARSFYFSNQPEKVLPAWEKARGILEKLVRKHPAKVEFLRALHEVHSDIGTAYSDAAKTEDALREYTIALDLLDQAQAKSGKPEYDDFKKANLLFNIGLAMSNAGRCNEAIDYYNQALPIRENLASQYPDQVDRQAQVGQTYMSLADCHRFNDNFDEAKKLYLKAMAIIEPLVKTHSEAVVVRIDLANCYGNYGRLFKEQNQLQDAMTWYDKDIEQLEYVLRKAKRHVWAEQALAVAHFEKGLVYTMLGKHDEALKEWDKTLLYDKPEDRDETRLKRAATLARLGRYAEAVKDTAEVPIKSTAKLDADWEVCCVFVLASQAVRKDGSLSTAEQVKRADDYAHEAVQTLEKARAKGYFKNPNNRHALTHDPDLEPLRARTDFKKLLVAVEVEAK
jgi:serine/threonine protein kinase